MNSAGTSPPTADVVVRVGAAPPGVPRNVRATTAPGGAVSLAWDPPDTGGAPAYYVLVAGLTPTATTYQIPVGGTVLATSGVSPATYYVRIVALNGAGVGPLTSPLAVTVSR